MSEASPEFSVQAGSDVLTQVELALVTDVLGSAFALNEKNLSSGYDERRELAWDTLDAVFAMQESLRDRRGQQLQIDDPLGWRPNKNQREQLLTQLAPVQRRFRMLRGAEGCIRDEGFIDSLPGTSLRWNQEEITDDTANFALFSPRTTPEGGKSGVIVSPTGSGKTPAIAKIISMLKYGEAKHDPARILVLEPTQALVTQTVGAKGDRGLGRFAPQLDVGEYYERNKQLEKDVVVMCFPSFMKLFEEGKLPFFDAVIVDEAHLAIGEKISEMIRRYCNDKLLIGATATDRYSPERTVYELFQHQIYRMKLVEAIRRAVLAPTRAFLLKAEPVIDISTLPTDPAESKRAVKAARVKARLEAAIPYIQKEVERGVGIFVKVPPGDDTKRAVDYAKMLSDLIAHSDQGLSQMRWINANPVTGSRKRQTLKKRLQILEEFDEGSGDALVAVRILREGIHLSHNKAFFNCDPGESDLEQEQWMGRSLSLTVDPFTEQPIEARFYDFEDPDLGSRQSTAVKILKTKHNQPVTPERSYKEEDEASKIRRRQRRQPPEAKIQAIKVGQVGEFAVRHARSIRLSAGAGSIALATATFRNETLNLPDAARELGIAPRELGRLLAQLGSSSEVIRREDLPIIRDLFPGKLKFPDLPLTGWTDIRDVARDIAESVEVAPRLLAVVGTARVNGIHSSTYRAPSGMARFYSDEQVNQIRSLYRLSPLTTDGIRALASDRAPE